MKAKYSLNKSDKLLKPVDFTEVFKHKKCLNINVTIRIYYKLNENNKPRFGLIVSKKVAKKATDRNYMKRVFREWFRLNKQILPSGDYIFFVKQRFSLEDFHEINRQLNYFQQKLTKSKP